MKRFMLILLALSMCVSVFGCRSEIETEISDNGQEENDDMNGTKIVYIPLDNRPVNFTRVKYLAEASGMELVMPDEALISNTLGEDYDQGNPEEIFRWLKGQNADYYVISLDMLFSGGLIGSRAPFDDEDDSIANQSLELGKYTLSQTEQEIVNYLADLSKNSHVVLFDTVMRLASTANYGGWDMNLYNFLRDRYASVERKQLYGDELTLENIITGYKSDVDGKSVSTVYGGKDHGETVEEYLRGRERKLRIADALYSLCGNDVAGLFIGVDDSTAKTNIQTNEIRYLEEKLMGDSENTLLFAGADELGLMGISEVVTSIHGEITINLQYFGEGEDYVADGYDPATLRESLVAHIDAVGAKTVDENADMEVLVLTRSASGGTNATVHQNNVASLVAKLEENLKNNIPTCVIDASAYEGYGALAQAMLDKNLEIGKLLGFSAWNTVSNSVGIALSNATARFSYLKNSKVITEESHKGFMKSIAFSHVKDTAYKKFGNLPFEGSGAFAANYEKFVDYSESLAERINASEIFVAPSTAENKYDISLSRLSWPWKRNFEADFVIEVTENGNSSVFKE